MRRTLTFITLLVAALSLFAAKPQIPLLDAAPYKTTIDGKKVALYTISNGTVAAQVTNYGGFLVSLFSPDKEGKYENLVTNYPDIQGYLHYNLGKVGPSVGRFANRIANGTFTLNGTEYHVTRNNGPHTLHGGTQGFDRVVWTVLKHTANKVVMQCVLPDGTDGFPGTLTTTLTYSITKDNGLSLTFESTTDKTTVVNTTCHSYFNLDGVGNGDIMNHELTIFADKITATDRANIPTGEYTPVDNTLFDFRQPVCLGDRIVELPRRGVPERRSPESRFEMPEGKLFQYDTNFCLIHNSDKAIEKVAVLYSPRSGRQMEVWNNHPGLQVYTGARTAIALESQKYPDSPNHPEFPSTVLNPGEKYTHTCVYKLSVRQ